MTFARDAFLSSSGGEKLFLESLACAFSRCSCRQWVRGILSKGKATCSSFFFMILQFYYCNCVSDIWLWNRRPLRCCRSIPSSAGLAERAAPLLGDPRYRREYTAGRIGHELQQLWDGAPDAKPYTQPAYRKGPYNPPKLRIHNRRMPLCSRSILAGVLRCCADENPMIKALSRPIGIHHIRVMDTRVRAP